MSPRPVLLDLFCGGGGSAEGYRRAGFRVIGVEIEDHSRAFARIGCEFHQMDWREGLRQFGHPAALSALQPCIHLPPRPRREVPRPHCPGSRGAAGDRQAVGDRERRRRAAD
jgi:hypothetical protein